LYIDVECKKVKGEYIRGSSIKIKGADKGIAMCDITVYSGDMKIPTQIPDFYNNEEE